MKKYNWLFILLAVFLLGRFVCNNSITQKESNPLIERMEFNEMNKDQKTEVLEKVIAGDVEPYKRYHIAIALRITQIANALVGGSNYIARWDGKIINAENGLIEVEAKLSNPNDLKDRVEVKCGLIYTAKNMVEVITEKELEERIKKLPNTKPEKIVSDSPREIIDDKIKSFRGAGSLKPSTFKNGAVKLEFVDSYDEYKKINPESLVSEEYWKNYWSTNDAVDKTLVDYAGRVFKTFEFAKSLQLSLPFDGKNKVLKITRKELEAYTKMSIKEMSSDWEKKYVDTYVYDKAKRKKFIQKFVK